MIVSSVREWGDAFRTETLVHMRENTGTIDLVQTFTKIGFEELVSNGGDKRARRD